MVVAEITQVVLNWRGFIAGIALGWVLGFITFFTIYVAWKVFPRIDSYVNIVKSYTKFMRQDYPDKKVNLLVAFTVAVSILIIIISLLLVFWL
jgi:hypothetical protein